MKKYTTHSTLIDKFPKSVDINNYIQKFCFDKNINNAWFSFIGSLESVTLGFYNQITKIYDQKKFNQPYEIISGTGNISLKDDKVFSHSHLVLSDKNYNVIGGHLFKSKVFAGEFVLKAYEGPLLNRSFDNATGLSLWI